MGSGIREILNSLMNYEKQLTKKLKNYSGSAQLDKLTEEDSNDYIMELSDGCKAPHSQDLLTSKIIPARYKSLYQIQSLIQQYNSWVDGGGNPVLFDEEIIPE